VLYFWALHFLAHALWGTHGRNMRFGMIEYMAGRGTGRMLAMPRANVTAPIEQARRGLGFVIAWGAIFAVAGISYAARRRVASGKAEAEVGAN
jgi:hypothetical protein